MNETQITLQDEEGKDIIFDIVHSFYVEAIDKAYLLLVPVDAIYEDEDEAEIYPYEFTLDEEGNIADLIPIESDEEWTLIEAELTRLNEEESGEIEEEE